MLRSELARAPKGQEGASMKDKMKRSLMSAAKSMASKGGSGEGPAGLEEKKTAVAVGAPPARAVPAAPPVPFGEGKAVDPAEKTGLTMSSFMARAGAGGGGSGWARPHAVAAEERRAPAGTEQP